MRSFAFSALCLALVTVTASAASPNPVVAVTGGQVEGRLGAKRGASFKGLPFAAPPIGANRWREPQPVKAWAGVRDASKFGASCVQNVVAWNRQEATGNQEDCLYLNIWTPEWPASSSKKAVMFWIHGGGNTGGGASVDYFDGASLASKDVVVVTINYRLGLFGFYAHPALTAESAHHASGNYALLDQVAALKWVRDNIAKFGGDPNNVTVFGQSAGATDTGLLMASPLAKGLFQRAIQQSGAPIRPMDDLRTSEQAGEKFAASLKAPAGKAGLDALRAMPAQDLQTALGKTDAAAAPPIGPIVDGYSMPDVTQNILANGKQHPVSFMMGNNAQEQRGVAPDALRAAVTDSFGIHAQQALAFYGLDKPGDGNVDPKYGPATKQHDTDTRRRCLAVQQATWQTKLTSSVYEYEFDPPIAGRPTTEHSAELPFLFGNLLPGGFLGGPFTANDQKISNTLQVYWTNFAKTGDPNGPGVPVWPKFDPAKRGYIEFTADGPVAKTALRKELCDLFMDNLSRQIARR